MSKGFGFSGLMQQAKDLQEQLSKVQEEAANRTARGTAGGGMVEATVNGRLELLSLEIDPSVLAGDDPQMLKDLIVAAVNQALRAAQQQMADEMGKLTGGLKIPGLG